MGEVTISQLRSYGGLEFKIAASQSIKKAMYEFENGRRGRFSLEVLASRNGAHGLTLRQTIRNYGTWIFSVRSVVKRRVIQTTFVATVVNNGRSGLMFQMHGSVGLRRWVKIAERKKR